METILKETPEQAAAAVNEMLKMPIQLPHPSFATGKHLLIYNTEVALSIPWRGEAFIKGTEPSGYLRRARINPKEMIESFIEQYGQPDAIYVFNSRAAAKAVFPEWFNWLK